MKLMKIYNLLISDGNKQMITIRRKERGSKNTSYYVLFRDGDIIKYDRRFAYMAGDHYAIKDFSVTDEFEVFNLVNVGYFAFPEDIHAVDKLHSFVSNTRNRYDTKYICLVGHATKVDIIDPNTQAIEVKINPNIREINEHMKKYGVKGIPYIPNYEGIPVCFNYNSTYSSTNIKKAGELVLDHLKIMLKCAGVEEFDWINCKMPLNREVFFDV